MSGRSVIEVIHVRTPESINSVSVVTSVYNRAGPLHFKRCNRSLLMAVANFEEPAPVDIPKNSFRME